MIATAYERTLQHINILMFVVASVIVASTLVRLFLAGTLELHFDEAYYWYWSKNLQLSYYDHPPAVAWLIKTGTSFLGDTELGVRLAGQLCVLIITYLLYDAARRAYSAPSALIAIAAMHVTLVVGAGSIIMTPDTPLLLFASIALWALVRLTLEPSGWWWLMIGFGAGGSLLSKYTAVLFIAAIVIWAVVTPRIRHWLPTRWPWLGAALAAALALPVLIWNMQHGWISFIKQGGRLVHVSEFRPELIFEYIGGQIGVITPGLFVLLLAALWVIVRQGWRSVAPLERLLVLWFLVPAAFFLAVSPFLRVQANWLAPAWPAALLVLAHLHAHSSKFLWLSRALKWSLSIGAAMVALVWLYALTLFGSCGNHDPLAQLTGQRTLAAEIGNILRENGSRQIITADYATASMLRFYLPGIQITHLTDTPRYAGFTNERIARPAIAVVRKPQLPAGLKQDFSFKSSGTELWRNHKGCPSRPYYFFTSD